MFSSLVVSLLATVSALVTASPTTRTGGNSTRAPALWINGNFIDYTSPGVRCSPDEDVLSCATKLLGQMNVEQNATFGTHSLTVHLKSLYRARRFLFWIDAGYINIDYTVGVEGCNKSNPVVVSKAPLFFCNTGSCSEEFSFTHSQTESTTYGYSLDTSLQLGGKIKILTIGYNISFNFKREWSTSKTQSTTVKRVYNMKHGEICAATSIQANVDCRYSYMTLDKATWFHPNGRSDELSAGGLEALLGKDDYRITGELPEFLRALKSHSPVRLDVGTQARGFPWTIEGCMYR
ncbi:hypothetical protein JDV02_008807 [Purpureocillium takamizusanense]|uniref:Uncharacterized protein n=1 Tax=Purpureocillium takamizusanense TaxID=2060973 RepID=A0A9Q8QQL0_9HYPO|nr:uncharacterized protein JDV02_008807 [Purpureocillium takamizusanense]UNI22964.1 hypothetical protein JDV02_008807 [Purpureocillium takamizusanense]